MKTGRLARTGCAVSLTGTSSDWCSREQGAWMGRGLVANQYASTAVRAPMPTSVVVGRERKNCPRSSMSGILRPLIISWACIFSIRVELSSGGNRGISFTSDVQIQIGKYILKS